MCSHTCVHTRTHSHSPGLSLRCPARPCTQGGPFPSAVLIPAHSLLPGAHLINRAALRTHNHTLTLTRSPGPTRTGTDPRGNTFRSFTPDTLPAPVPASPLHGTPTGAAPAPGTSPPTPPASTFTRLPAAESSTSGRPAPQPVHTYGKLPEVAAFSSPSARGGPLSGYQEVNGECQGGGSSTLPVR